MDKKTIAYILIAIGALAGAYFLYKKSQATAAANALGAGQPDGRGAWAADDDKTYAAMRNRVMSHTDKYDGAQALGWIDQGVEERYASGDYFHKIKGQPTKAGAFLSVMEAINPHPDGKFTGNQSGGKTQLFPDSLLTALRTDFNKLKVKYGGL